MSNYVSTKIIELGSCAFRQFSATHSHCQYIHGYQLKGKFWFGCNQLDEKNWAVDFGGLKEFKNILQKQFDHTLCVAGNDPCLEVFQHLHNLGACDLRVMEDGVGIEKTAEWCFNAADKYIKENYGNRCWVEKVEVFEHELNSAIYTKPKLSTAWTITDSTTIPHTSVTDTTPEPAAAPVQEAPTPEVVTPSKPSNAAAVGNNITSGWSNPFAGTSWGV
jgi:6-pyruvoyltetrahydropterin/6-carboxytetrahydropterin synthase